MSASSGNGGGVKPVPAGSLKMVQSLKEIVNCSEAEIYAALKDCNMDPNEAVNRLLSQDPFHEVKSKREKKKEGKDPSESRPRGLNQNSSRGSKTDSSPLPGKSSYKKENVSNPYTNSLSSMHGVSGNDRSTVPASFSDDISAESKGSSFWTADSMPPGIQPASGYQSAWAGPPGQVSMADIVKVGRPENKAPNAPNLESGIYSDQHLPTNNEWPSMSSIGNPVISFPAYNVDSEQYIEARDVPAECINRPYESEETVEAEDDIENSGAYNLGYDSFSSRKIPEDDSRSASLFRNDLYDNMSPHQHRPHDFHEDEEIGAQLSSVTRSLQQLNVEKDVRGLPSDGYTYMPSVPSLIIPDHLRAQNVDCSHLSFGSYGRKTSLPVKSRMEEPHNAPDLSSFNHLNNRSSEYYVKDSLGNASDVGLFHRTNAIVGNYDPSSPLQPRDLKTPENGEFGNQYSYPPSNRGYAFDDAQPLNASFNQPSSQMQILGSLSNNEPYTNSLPSNFSPANVHITGRESGIQLSQFPETHSLSSKYGNLLSPINGSAGSMSEDLKTGPLTQHLAAHQFSKPTHSPRPYTNMMGYPFLPQNYSYVPSALNQTFAGDNTYHQSLSSLLPQYKNSAPDDNLHQSRYGGAAFGNSPVGPGNYQTNHQPFSYDDEALSSRYKDSNSHLVSLQQQNENSGMWLNSKGGNYYDYQEAGGGFRRGQQHPSQNYGNYPNIYQAQGRGELFDQQQNPRDGLFGGAQGKPKQSEMWQNGY